MLTPQIFETPIRRTREKLQWYSIVISLYKGERWRIEEEVKEKDRAKYTSSQMGTITKRTTKINAR